jgi:hypothetical protein
VSHKNGTLEWRQETETSATGRALGTNVTLVVTEPSMPRRSGAVRNRASPSLPTHLSPPWSQDRLAGG